MTAVGPSTHAGSGVKYTYVGCKGHTVDSKERERRGGKEPEALTANTTFVSLEIFLFQHAPSLKHTFSPPQKSFELDSAGNAQQRDNYFKELDGETKEIPSVPFNLRVSLFTNVKKNKQTCHNFKP
jgi:hypothetical protein